MIDPLAPVLATYYATAGPATEIINAHDLDLDEIIAHAGTIATAYGIVRSGSFTFDECGEKTVVIEVYDADDETTVDLVAWPVSKPETFGTALGVATVLGAARIINPATWAFGGLLAVHRTPLDWLKADCQGVVILDHRLAGYALADALGPLLAEGEQHARSLKTMLCRPPVDPANILFPVRARRAA